MWLLRSSTISCLGFLLLLLSSASAELRSDEFNTVPNVPWDRNAPAQINTWQKYEAATIRGRYFSPFVFSGGLHPVSTSLTATIPATVAFVPEPVNQVAIAVTYAPVTSDDVCWVIISSQTVTIATWTRVNDSAGKGTAFQYQCQGNTTALRPALPANSVWLMQLTITANAIAGVTSIKRPGVMGCIPVPNAGSLSSVVSALGTTPATICIEDATSITTSFTIPGTIGLVVRPMGSFRITAGRTLTHNGAFVVEDGLRQIFFGSGSTAPIAFGSGYTGEFFPEWWGAVADGTTDSTAGIQAAVDASNVSKGKCTRLAAGRYRITDTIQVIGQYSSTTYPDVEVLDVGLCGAGTHATFIEWNSTLTLQTVRKAALFIGGRVMLRDFTVLSPRIRRLLNSSFATYNTAYYGIVVRNTSWKMKIENIEVMYFHVPFSAGIIKTYVAAGANGLEFEPAAGGSAFPTLDFAQVTLHNLRLRAYTHEFFDGTLNAVSQNNANGTNLARGAAHTTDLTSAAFSDGSYGVELGAQNTVAITFDTCTIENGNSDVVAGVIVNGTIRLHNVGHVGFVNSLLSSPPFNNAYSYSIFENIGSGGSDIVILNSYLIGGIYTARTSQGSLLIKNVDGENSSGVNGNVRLFSPLVSAGANSFGATISVDGMNITRGSQTTDILLSTGAQGTTPVSPYGTPAGFVTPHQRIMFSGVMGDPTLLFGHETVKPGLQRLRPTANLLYNIPALLAGKPISPLFLATSIYLPAPAQGAANFTNSTFVRGTWFLRATASLGVNHVFAPMTQIDAGTAYNVSVDVYVSMVPGNAISTLDNDLSVVVRFFDSAQVFMATNPILLGASTSTFNYSSLADGQVTRLKQYHIIPPTGAAYMAVLVQTNPVAARVVWVGFGNIRIWPAPTEDVLEKQTAPVYVSTAAPTTGTWVVGDRVANSAPSVGSPKGWLCTVAGTPGTWVSEGNL